MISEALPGPRLLLVDDDETFCGVLGEALEKRGFAVLVAHNVPDARRLAEAEAPQYAVVDLRMPGPSGLELVSALCQADGAAKVVVLTGFASITTAVEAIKLGATHYLTKPTDADEIVAAFDRDEGDSAGQPRAPADLGGSARMGAYPAGAHGMRRECLECGAAARDAQAHAAAQAEQAPLGYVRAMKFDLDHGMGRYAIRGYRQGAIMVNDEALTQSFIITTDRLVRDWPPQGFEEMTAEHLDQIAALGPEVAVLGTGARGCASRAARSRRRSPDTTSVSRLWTRPPPAAASWS